MHFKAFKITAYHTAIVCVQWTTYDKFVCA